MSNSDFAAFVMTFERSEILPGTLNAIFDQTFPPSKVLIVDNSVSSETEKLVQSLGKSNVEYYKVGYNSGPAGASKIGLKKLIEEGYKWIYWGDDDNPPLFRDCFEILMKEANEKMGIIGAVGSVFDWNTGIRKRYKD